jgi:putative transposase
VYAFSVFDRLLDFGLPKAVRTDNRTRFTSAHSLFGVTKLSVWWLRLGIALERIMPAHPQQNDRQQRMHWPLKQQAIKPAAKNFLQQGRFDAFLEEFNNERPHEAIGMRCPNEDYRPSPRFYQSIGEETFGVSSYK